MRNMVTGSLGGMALLAVVLHTLLPAGSEAPAPRYRPTAATGATQDTGGGSKEEEGTGENVVSKDQFLLEGPWIATRAYFHQPVKPRDPNLRFIPWELATREHVEKPDVLCGLLGVAVKRSDAPEIWSIVATVPDPQHTRLTLALDGHLEAIMRSLDAAGWHFAGQWLPWMDRPQKDETDLAKVHAQNALKRAQEQMPGVLIFRSGPPFYPRRTLLVFVVGETVTGGIRAAPFFASLHMAAAVSGQHEIGLLTPCFSGSFPSLAQILVEWNSVSGREGRLHHTIYSGQSSDQVSARELAGETGFEVRGGEFNADDSRRAIEGALREFGIAKGDAAFLVEDNSGYSAAIRRNNSAQGKQAAATAPGEFPTYYFPRDISHLRNASPENVAATSSEPYLEQSPRVGLTLKDPNIGEDSVPKFSGVQEVLAQQAILDTITADLRQRHTRMVYIAATNSLDSLFLARVLHRDSPDTRALIDRPHVLFEPAATAEGLSGTLFLSTYPIFPEGERWLAGGVNHYFADANDQGWFNVTQLLLDELDTWPGPRQPLSLRGYRGLRSGAAQPEMWLLTLSRAGFQPLDLIDPGSSGEAWFKPDPSRGSGTGYPPGFALPTGWGITVMAFRLAVLIACIAFLLARGDTREWFPLWLFMGKASEARTEAFVGIALSLIALEWLLVLPAASLGLAWNAAAPWPPVSVVPAGSVLLALVVLLPGFLFAPAMREVFRHGSKTWYQCLGSVASVFAVPGLVFGAIVGFWAATCGGEPAAFLFRYRAVNLYWGLSPVWPPVLLCLLLLYYSYQQFRRRGSAEIDSPRLGLLPAPNQTDATALEVSAWQKLDRRYRDLNDSIEPRAFDGAWWLRFGISLLAASLASLLLIRPAQALEVQQYYNWVLRVELGAVFFFLSMALSDVWMMGGRIAEFLNRCELMPLGTALRRVAREWPRQSIWAFRLRKDASRLRIRKQMLAALMQRKQAQNLVAPGPAGDQLERLRGAMFTTDLPQAERVQALEKFQNETTNLSREILWDDLASSWRLTPNYDGESAPPTGAQTAGLEPARGSSEFVALQFCRYILYAVEQLERQAKCVLMSFLILLVFFNCYNLQAPQFAARTLAVMLLVIGVVVVRAFVPVERNSMVSLISRTTPGKLNYEFWMRLGFLGGLPLLGIVAHLFPEISEFLTRWVAPGIGAVK